MVFFITRKCSQNIGIKFFFLSNTIWTWRVIYKTFNLYFISLSFYFLFFLLFFFFWSFEQGLFFLLFSHVRLHSMAFYLSHWQIVCVHKHKRSTYTNRQTQMFTKMYNQTAIIDQKFPNIDVLESLNGDFSFP